MKSKETFNEYLGAVERLRKRGIPRADAHWQILNTLWYDMADRVKDTKRDPRTMNDGALDSWLGWLVVEWNRVA